jgi:hypothetical protein
MSVTMRRVASGLYRTPDGRYRVERARAYGGGVGVGWNLFDDDQPDPYMGSYFLKADALQALAVVLGDSLRAIAST